MLEACLPLGPCVTSNWTFWPSLRVLKPFIWIAEKCANKSSPPSSGVIKPKPLESLNHLTVPVAIKSIFQLKKITRAVKARSLARLKHSAAPLKLAPFVLTSSNYLSMNSIVLVKNTKVKSFSTELLSFCSVIWIQSSWFRIIQCHLRTIRKTRNI